MPPALRGSGVGGVPPPSCKARRKATMLRTGCCWCGVTATAERAQSRGRAAQTPWDLWQTQKELSEGWSSSKRGRRNRPPVCQEKQGLTWSWRLGRSDLRAGSAPRETTRPAEGGEEASRCWHRRHGLAGPARRHGSVDEADCRPVHVPEGTSAVWGAVSQPGAQRPRTEPRGRGREEAGGPKAHPRRGEKGTESMPWERAGPQVPQDPWRLLTERSAHPPWVRGSAQDVHPTERGPCATEACHGVAAAGSTAPNWDDPAPEPVRLTGQGSQDGGTAEPPARRQSPLSRRAASLGPAWGAGRAAPARACGPVRGLP